MAEVTRVPLKPISRGSLVMLFAGILIGLLIAAAFAWFTAPKGVSVEEVRAGTGDSPTASDVVFVHYTGKLEDGTVFDQSQPLPLPVLPRGCSVASFSSTDQPLRDTIRRSFSLVSACRSL